MLSACKKSLWFSFRMYFQPCSYFASSIMYGGSWEWVIIIINQVLWCLGLDLVLLTLCCCWWFLKVTSSFLTLSIFSDKLEEFLHWTLGVTDTEESEDTVTLKWMSTSQWISLDLKSMNIVDQSTVEEIASKANIQITSQLWAFSALSVLSFERPQPRAFSASSGLSFERSQLRAFSASSASALSFECECSQLQALSASSVLSRLRQNM